jgi:hypothetical protein
VVGVWVGGHGEVDAFHPEGGQARGDLVGLGAGIDEHHGAARGRHDRRIALAHVEESEGEARGWADTERGRPDQERQQRRRGDDQPSGQRPARTQPPGDRPDEPDPHDHGSHPGPPGRDRGHRGRGQAVGQGLEVAQRHDRHRHEDRAHRRRQLADARGGQAEEHRRRHRGERQQVRREGDQGDLLEVEQQQRTHPRLRRQGRGRGQGDRARQPGEPLRHRRGQREDAGRGRHGELEADRSGEARVGDQQNEDRRPQGDDRAPRPAGEHPGQRDHGHHPGPEHRRLGPGEQHEEDDRAGPHGEPGPPRRPQQDGQADDRGEDHRDVLPRHGQQVAEARGPEVLLERGVEPAVVTEGQPEEEAGVPVRESPVDAPMEDRADALDQTKDRVGGGAQAVLRVHLEHAERPARPSELRHVRAPKPDVPLDLEAVPPYGLRRSAGPVEEDRHAPEPPLDLLR